METGSKQHIYQEMRALLNEKQWRQYLAIEAQQRGSVAEVAMEAGASRNTVKRTNEGLTVMAPKDSNPYPTELKVTDDELAALNLLRDPFHGEWNYTIKPQLQ